MNVANQSQRISVQMIDPEDLEQGAFIKRVEAFAVRHRNKLAWIHVAMFFGFMALMTVPLYLPLPGDNARFYNNFTLFANFVIWGLWFPLVFVSVVFTGRSWCGLLCPLGASSEWANRVGLKRPIPAWVRWEGTPIVSFAVITILAQTVDARDFSQGLAVVFGLTFVCAIVLGFVYGRGGSKRAWCRHACPIGLMLGVFSRLGAVQFSPKEPKARDDAYTERTICPTLIDINRKAESRHCIECFRCVNPKARTGLKVTLRPPGREVTQIRSHNPNTAEIWFLFIATGLSLGGFLWLILPQYETLRQGLGGWAIDQGWYWIGNPGPSWLMAVHPEGREVYTWLDFFMICGFMLACAALMTASLTLLTALSSLLSGRLGADSKFGPRFVEQAYAYMPIAMISLVVGLGGKLFEALHTAGIPNTALIWLKVGLFAGGALWSFGLGYRLVGMQGLAGIRRSATLMPLVAGVLLIGFCWWPAIFGM